MPSVIPRIAAALAPTLDFMVDREMAAMLDDPEVANFAVGNPQEMPLPELVAAVRDALVPKDKNWFAYKMNEPASQRTIAGAIGPRLDVPFSPRDIFVTNGIAKDMSGIALENRYLG